MDQQFQKNLRKNYKKKAEAYRRFKDREKQRKELLKNKDREVADDESYKEVPPIYHKHEIVINNMEIEHNQYRKEGNVVKNRVSDDKKGKRELDKQLVFVGSDDENTSNSEEENEDETINNYNYSKGRKNREKWSNSSELEESDEDEWDQSVNNMPNMTADGVYGFHDNKVASKINKAKARHPKRKDDDGQSIQSKIKPNYENNYDDHTLINKKANVRTNTGEYLSTQIKNDHPIRTNKYDEFEPELDDEYEDGHFVNKIPYNAVSEDHRMPYQNNINKPIKVPYDDDWNYKYFADRRPYIAVQNNKRKTEKKIYNEKSETKLMKEPDYDYNSEGNDNYADTNPPVHVILGKEVQPMKGNKQHYLQMDAPEDNNDDDNWDVDIFGKKKPSYNEQWKLKSRPNLTHLHGISENDRRRNEKGQITSIRAKCVLKQYIKGNGITHVKDGDVSELKRERIRREYEENKKKPAELRKLRAEEVRRRKAELEREDKRIREGTLEENDADEEDNRRLAERARKAKRMQVMERKQQEMYNKELILKMEDKEKEIKKREWEAQIKNIEEEKKRRMNEQKKRREEIIKKRNNELRKAQIPGWKAERNHTVETNKKTVLKNPNPHQNLNLHLNPKQHLNQQLSLDPNKQLKPQLNYNSNPNQQLLNSQLNLNQIPSQLKNPQLRLNPSQQLNSQSNSNPSRLQHPQLNSIQNPSHLHNPQSSFNPNKSWHLNPQPSLNQNPNQQLNSQPRLNPNKKQQQNQQPSLNPRMQLNPRPSLSPNPSQQQKPQPTINLLSNYNLQNFYSLDNIVYMNQVDAHRKY